jgi:predicted ATPase with chaperone activity
MLGHPGAGQSMLARRLTIILPAMRLAEALETTRLHRVARLTSDCAALTVAPWAGFPHDHVAAAGLTRGGLVKISPSSLGNKLLSPARAWSGGGRF